MITTHLPVPNREDYILRILTDGEDPTPKRLEQGIFECNHFNFNMYLPRSQEWEDYWFDDEGHFPDCYGVCDSVSQFKEKYFKELASDPDHEYAVSFSCLNRCDQPSSGGWRWHKWGPYVGTQDPQCEYLFDEPVIEQVFTFHVYRRTLK